MLSVNTSASKKMRISNSDQNQMNNDHISRMEWRGGNLPIELQWKIHSYLDLNVLVKLDLVCRTFLREMEFYWKELGMRNDAFAWREAKQTKNPSKWEYFLSKALRDINSQLKDNKNRFQIVNHLKNKYFFLMERFESFEYYARLRFDPMESQSDVKLWKKREAIDLNAEDLNSSSDAILKVLIALETLPNQAQAPIEWEDDVEQAISKGVTSAPLLIMLSNWKAWLQPSLERWSFLSAEKKDFRSLEYLLKSYPLERLNEIKSSHSRLAPVLYYCAMCEKNDQEKDDLIEKAIKAYDKKVTVEILVSAGNHKVKMEQFAKAYALYFRAWKRCRDENRPKILFWMADCKFKEKKYDKAEELFARGFSQSVIDKTEVSPWVYAHAGSVKLELENYDNADKLFTLARLKYGETVPDVVLCQAAQAKCHLDREDARIEADHLFTQVYLKDPESLSSTDLILAAINKFNLEDCDASMHYYCLALKKMKNPPPQWILDNIEQVNKAIQSKFHDSNLSFIG